MKSCIAIAALTVAMTGAAAGQTLTCTATDLAVEGAAITYLIAGQTVVQTIVTPHLPEPDNVLVTKFRCWDYHDRSGGLTSTACFREGEVENGRYPMGANYSSFMVPQPEKGLVLSATANHEFPVYSIDATQVECR